MKFRAIGTSNVCQNVMKMSVNTIHDIRIKRNRADDTGEVIICEVAYIFFMSGDMLSKQSSTQVWQSKLMAP